MTTQKRMDEDSIRTEIYRHSTDSAHYQPNNSDLFYSPRKGSGLWGLRDNLSPVAQDIEEPRHTTRVKTIIYRIIRDTTLARNVKKLYKSRCQICNETIMIGKYPYAEAHHIKPLGGPHFGDDVERNIMIVCPNHHVMLDFGVIQLDLNLLHCHPDHQIAVEYTEYHNQHIFGSIK